MAAHGSSELVVYSLDRLTGALAELLQRAVAAGEICADIDPEDLLRTLVGMCYAHDGPGWQAKELRLIDVFIDGLRRRPDKRDDRQASDALPWCGPDIRSSTQACRWEAANHRQLGASKAAIPGLSGACRLPARQAVTRPQTCC